MIEPYNYNNEPNGRSETLVQALERCERLEKQLKIAVEQLKDTYVICFRNKDSLLHTPEHNIIGGIERDCAIALQKIKKLNQALGEDKYE